MTNSKKIFIAKILRLLYKIFWIFPVKNKVIICSFGGKGYNDNPKYLVEEIHRRECNFKILCVVNDINCQVPPYVIKIKNHSLRMLYEYATSKLWISNARLPLYLTKRKHQYYIETWHGGVGFKKIGLAMKDITSFGQATVKHDSDEADFMISDCAHCTEIYRRDFLYTGAILELGMPRLDNFFNGDIKIDLHKILHLNKNYKLVMYAPTFRDNGRTDVYDIDFNRLKSSLEMKYGGNWAVLLRFHPAMREYSKNIEYSDWLINCSMISDIYELLKGVDMMITDYSSLGFEYSLSKRRVILYARDVEEYITLRGSYLDIYALPFPLCENNDELESAILNFDDEKYDVSLNKFLEEMGYHYFGNASKRIIDYLIENTEVLN